VLENRLDTYVEECWKRSAPTTASITTAPRPSWRFAAQFCGLARDEKSAQIVRRRAAAAA